MSKMNANMFLYLIKKKQTNNFICTKKKQLINETSRDNTKNVYFII